MNDMSGTIIPKSDQLNADSLLSGPITVKITGVEIAMGEQPVTIHYAGEEGRPYKPGKSMRRVLVAMWGADASLYTGRSMTLYCDTKVTFGGMAVGGIRISHLSDISGPATLALTETKGKKKPFVVRPLSIAQPPPSAMRQAAPKIDAAAQRDPAMVAWIDDTVTAFDRLKTAAAMFKLIDSIKGNRDVLREEAPELDARIDAAVKAANARLAPLPEVEIVGAEKVQA